jgi:hypothetical protein
MSVVSLIDNTNYFSALDLLRMINGITYTTYSKEDFELDKPSKIVETNPPLCVQASKVHIIN